MCIRDRPVKRLKRRASNEQALQHDASQRYLDSGWWKSLQRARLNYNNPALYPRCCRPAFWRRWVEVVVGCAGAPRYDSSCRLCIPVQRGWSSNVADHAEQLQLRRQRQISVRRCVECLWYVTWLARLGLILARSNTAVISNHTKVWAHSRSTGPISMRNAVRQLEKRWVLPL